MEWWQEIENLLVALGWWQLSLILIASILLGILLGLSIIFLVTRFILKQKVPFSRLFYTLFHKKHKTLSPSGLTSQFTNTPSASPGVHETSKFPISKLLAEIEHNLKICAESSGSEDIFLLQSDAWDASRDEASQLPNDLRVQLEKVYFDIRLLNHIASSSTKLDYRNSVLNELYRKRIPTIAEKLQRIKQDIENQALFENVVSTDIIRDSAKTQANNDFSKHSEIL